MDINRRSFLGMSKGVAAVAATGLAGCALPKNEPAAGKQPSRPAAPFDPYKPAARKPGPPRVMVIGAHPDDADLLCGGTTIKLITRGFKVKFVSVTDGRMGHHLLSPDATARRRAEETQEVARRMGLDGYDIYGYPDCGLYPTDEARRLVATKIREYQPDFVLTHRSCDYHADHRATGQIVMDAGYLLGVPHWCAEAPPQRIRPVILFLTDRFTNPKPFRPDLLVDVDPYLDSLCDGLDAQASQFYEWLPWDAKREHEIAALGDRSNIALRNEYFYKYSFRRKRNDAKRFASEWAARYPGRPLPKHLEAFEISEYGRYPKEEDIKLFLGE